ncbi:acetate kinase [Candidatus Arthromitus sp. SFB-mouse-Japan]|uniref:acetate/propionate family kinase n=1 Tax=unclassified Candidatus Neoarthromitus TaxID=2638829 RepID=UPI00021B801B|nr:MULTISPECIES: acetate kinase [unclassified Candidatus Arthromitus]EIA22274.1 Acetate kinase 2 [Candidatus Arthromitus sp. SFB-1]EIA25108.1 Acetate kinase 2 [Candidatus Arthromitus sp. SFB-2]EIA25923.1 Acetate kinase 2 [Candidatus Arthromitus sp. SFB-4]EIA29107.1 Acetate kinase 2 [Candidatus Arthromitus sp. SFB-co]EIA30675.1 Acetate kinase 2 [Candidatus Arthromitus sp. SFB-mouse-SU]
MKILVINCGSSSLKYQLIDMNTENAIAKGLVERIGIPGSNLEQKVDGSNEKYKVEVDLKNHKEAIALVLKTLCDDRFGLIKDLSEINAIGHRVVHGGEKYSKSVIVDEEVIKNIEECIKLAPLHNPANLIGIKACRELMKDTPMVVVFDTAFHQTISDKAFMYGLPYELYEKYSIRKYGFHGTSHFYVANECARAMGKSIEDLKIITCHLGNGASVSAVNAGKSVDTSMGFTPLQGLMMGTRCGDIDPAVVTFLIDELNMSGKEVNELMNKKSGFLGVSGKSSDSRDIEDLAQQGDKRAKLTLDMYCYRIKSYIGSYIAAMNGVDAIVFTAGIGENSAITRYGVCKDMESLGIIIDENKNNVRGKLTEISADNSKVKIYLIPTNEELVIARDTQDLLK